MESVAVVRRFFEITGYTPSSGVLYIPPFNRRSPNFEAGGYEWCILFYPNVVDIWDYVTIYLCLETHAATVKTEVDISLIDPTAALPPWNLTTPPLSWEFDSGDENKTVCGVSFLKSQLNGAPGPGFLSRGGLLFEVTITVLTTDALPAFAAQPKVPPPSEKSDNLARIYATKEGADVTYSVQGKLFPAHKIILAMESPVFKAELYGGMKESTAKVIEVKDMDPDVFEALLDYIYTDRLPTGGGHGEADKGAKLGDLLVAGDRYGLERLKLLCEHQLCKALHIDNVAKMLQFASDQQCNALKDACTEFLVNSDEWEKIVATEGYRQLHDSRPAILLQVLQRSHQFRKV